MELRKDLELVDVEYENGGKKAVMTFLDRDRREVRVVNFNKQNYSNGQFVDDPEKAAKVEEWCKQFFDCAFDVLDDQIGTKHDVYVYDTFNSLFEIDVVEKFTEDMNGQIYQTAVKEITLDDYFIKIRYDIEGRTYESKQTFGVYVESTKEWFLDPQRKAKEFKKFEEKYGVPVEDRDKLIGHDLIVEVKCAFGKHYYGDIKRFPKK